MASGVEFEEDSFSFNKPRPAAGGGHPGPGISRPGYNPLAANQPPARGMVGWLIKHGFVKSENGAQTFLVAIVVLNLIITFVVISYIL